LSEFFFEKELKMNSGTGIAICVVVCIAVFILIVVAVVVAVVVALRPYVELDHFTAEVRTDYGGGHVLVSRDVTLDSAQWWSEQCYINDKTNDYTHFSRVFSDEYDGYITLCNHFGGSSDEDAHENCYSLTSTSIGSYTVPFLMSRKAKKVDCPKIHDPVLLGKKNRAPELCDVYEYITKDFERYDYIEHDTDYPVVRIQISYDKNGVLEYNVSQEYTYFDGEKPTNTTGLTPPKGATVYDFRNGHSNTASAGARVVNWFKSLFARPAAKTYQNPTEEAAFRRFERERAFRERANIHFYPTVTGPAIGPIPAHLKVRDDTPIPDSFDAREHWSSCKNVIGTITNQKTCGSCWAMSTAAVLSDRACIKFNSSFSYSPRYMMGCYPHQLGCNGGYVGTVWNDVRDFGTVSETCFPFEPSDCDCPTRCDDGTTITDNMKLKVKGFYARWDKDSKKRVEKIQREIMTNGPVTVSMLVFNGFSDMSNSVYHRSSYEDYAGGHMVRIIGWGTSSGTDYWLVANSWGTDWNEKGLFKIRRGTNECNIESTVVAGYF